MVNARNFGSGQSRRWTLESVWRRKVTRYGDLCRKLGASVPGSTAWHNLTTESAKAAKELFEEIAALEMKVDALAARAAKTANELHEQIAALELTMDELATRAARAEAKVPALEVTQNIDTVTGNLTGVHIDTLG